MTKKIVLGTDELTIADAKQQFAGDVRYYLSQAPRQLPSRYLYDALGSALFEAICQLPWYALTRAEERLLREHATDILPNDENPPLIVELGSGSGDKLSLLIDSTHCSPSDWRVHLIDISSSALERATRTLEASGDVRVVTHQGTYEEGLAQFSAARARDQRALVLFLGSNIGNFDRPGCEAFLRAVRHALGRGDVLLLGADLVKPEPTLLLAYDDPLGVTAAFNRNLLVRINRELSGDFDLDAFKHRAVWAAGHSRVEMHLVSLRRQHVTIRDAQLDFEMQAGESIWTESSYKYTPEEIAVLVEGCGFSVRDQWIDTKDQFALTRALVV